MISDLSSVSGSSRLTYGPLKRRGGERIGGIVCLRRRQALYLLVEVDKRGIFRRNRKVWPSPFCSVTRYSGIAEDHPPEKSKSQVHHPPHQKTLHTATSVGQFYGVI